MITLTQYKIIKPLMSNSISIRCNGPHIYCFLIFSEQGESCSCFQKVFENWSIQSVFLLGVNYFPWYFFEVVHSKIAQLLVLIQHIETISPSLDTIYITHKVNILFCQSYFIYIFSLLFAILGVFSTLL